MYLKKYIRLITFHIVFNSYTESKIRCFKRNLAIINFRQYVMQSNVNDILVPDKKSLTPREFELNIKHNQKTMQKDRLSYCHLVMSLPSSASTDKLSTLF